MDKKPEIERGAWCSSSDFLDKSGTCRNPDGCTCATIARLQAELASVLRREEDANRAAFNHMRRAEAVEALLPSAYEAGRDDAHRISALMGESMAGTSATSATDAICAAIRALPVPADLAARLGGAE